jgi:hypothetical protein
MLGRSNWINDTIKLTFNHAPGEAEFVPMRQHRRPKVEEHYCQYSPRLNLPAGN